jgi:hypothetical protein
MQIIQRGRKNRTIKYFIKQKWREWFGGKLHNVSGWQLKKIEQDKACNYTLLELG